MRTALERKLEEQARKSEAKLRELAGSKDAILTARKEMEANEREMVRMQKSIREMGLRLSELEAAKAN